MSNSCAGGGLVFTLIGLILEFGSAIKGAGKFIIKGANEVIGHLADLLRAVRRFLPDISDLNHFRQFVLRNWDRICAAGRRSWDSAFARANRIYSAARFVLRSRIDWIGDILSRIRDIAPLRIRSAYQWVHQKINEVVEQVQARLGRRTQEPSTLSPIAGAEEIRVSDQEYLEAMGMVFPGRFFNRFVRVTDGIGDRAAQRAVSNPQFVFAVQNGNWPLAGTLFHSAAAQEVRNLPASALPAGWVIEAERTIQAGLGGSRADILISGPNGEIIEYDWKTTGRSAISFQARREMSRHAGQITSNIGGTLVTQESKSWVDFVRPLLHGVDWP